MHVCARVIPHRNVQSDGKRRVIRTRLGVRAQLSIGVNPRFEWPRGDAVRKRPLRLRQVPDDLTCILSKNSRHALLRSRPDRYGDTREQNAKRSEE